MSAPDFEEWKVYDELEPIGGKRLDYVGATVAAAIFNVHRNTTRYPKPFPVAPFLIQFDQVIEGGIPKPQRPSWQQMKNIGREMAAMYNKDERKKRHRG